MAPLLSARDVKVHLRVHGRLIQRGDAVGALGENGERSEDARVRPPHVVRDERVRLIVLKG
ncbi:MAG: hypothetical protein WCP68_22740, partial [Enhydrobacter sp.]